MVFFVGVTHYGMRQAGWLKKHFQSALGRVKWFCTTAKNKTKESGHRNSPVDFE